MEELEKQKETRKKIQEAWAKIGFLDGLEGYCKESVQTLFESEATHSLKDENITLPIVRTIK